MIFKLGELFCGPGGLALGAQLARFTDSEGQEWGFQHCWANDYDKATVATYTINILHNPDAKTVFCEDVAQLPIGDKELLPDIDAFAFGFPCNDYSNVGEKRGLNGKFGPLYSYGVEVLQKYQPKVFLAENVSGLSSANKGKALVQILHDLQDSGYHLTPNLYKFEEYGVPQTRHRIIVVGIRNDLYEQGIHFHVPAPTTPDPDSMITCQQALEDPPIPPLAPNNERSITSKLVSERMSYIPEGGNVWSDAVPQQLRLHTNGARLSSIYRRLDHTKPAYTVTAAGGGGTYMYHWSENRALTNRERARLQTFPDDFWFLGSKQSVRKQIGMAVPPLGAEIIFKAILKTFAGIKYDWVQPTAKLQLRQLV